MSHLRMLSMLCTYVHMCPDRCTFTVCGLWSVLRHFLQALLYSPHLHPKVSNHENNGHNICIYKMRILTSLLFSIHSLHGL